jgi:hypothetical protein
MSPEADEKAAEMGFVEGCPGWAAVADMLEEQGLTKGRVSARTALRGARRAVKRQGGTIRYARGKPRRALTALNMRKRLAFVQANQGRDWSRVMFTDRKRFQFRYPGVAPGTGRWLRPGQKWEALSVSHPRSYNVYCGLTLHGCVRASPCAGTTGQGHKYKTKRGQPAKNITQHEYRDVLLSNFCPSGQGLLGPGPWTLQQDGDRAHGRAGLQLATFNRANGSHISLLPNWPPNSPDLNLIENVWAYVQRRVDQAKCKTFPQFCRTVDFELTNLDPLYITSLYDSMPKRLTKCKRLKGGKTGY